MAKSKKKATPKKAAKKAVKVVKKAKCAAKTKAGKACPRYAVGKSKFCALHRKKK